MGKDLSTKRAGPGADRRARRCELGKSLPLGEYVGSILAAVSSGYSPRQIAGRAGPCIWGSSTLTSTLLEHGLAEEILLIVYPVLLGTGKRFFAEGNQARGFELLSTNVTPSGIIFSTY